MESIAALIRKLFPPPEEPFRTSYANLPDEEKLYVRQLVFRGERARDARTAWFAQRLAESGERRRRSLGFKLMDLVTIVSLVLLSVSGALLAPVLIGFAAFRIVGHFMRERARRAIALNAPFASPPNSA